MQSSQSLPANSGEKDWAHHDVETVAVPSHHGQKVVMVGNEFWACPKNDRADVTQKP
jgi:hypothetical protein